MKNSFCSYCGLAFNTVGWPRPCSCGNVTYRNPIPVAVVLVPIGNGLLLVRRGIEPKKGQLAFPGGFLDCDETWREGAARELVEETGIVIDPATLSLVDVISSPSNSMLVFCEAPRQELSVLKYFIPNEEVTEVMVVNYHVELAFPSHSDMMKSYLDEIGEECLK
jgi:ADP-ribose pyrophosphatase YjhB (NUDIX family)